MPRESVDEYWKQQIRSISANNPRFGPGRIQQALMRIGEENGRTDWPSLRTIGRVLSAFRTMADPDRHGYLDFYWPEAMERGDLPWEASGRALELLGLVHRLEISWIGIERERPSIDLVRWF